MAAFLTTSLKSNIPDGSNPLVGSSKIRSFGFDRSEAAKPKRCFIPSEYFLTLSSILFSRPTNFMVSSTCVLGMFLILAICIKFSLPDKYLYNSGFSTTAPTSFKAFSVSFFKSCPQILMLPPFGFISPTNILIVVVFPAPFGPKKPNISPSSTEKEISFIISLFPSFFLSPFTSKTFNLLPPLSYLLIILESKS